MRTEQQAVVVTSERQERTCPALPMLTPQEDSPLSLFEKSMTLAEREGSLDSWSRARGRVHSSHVVIDRWRI